MQQTFGVVENTSGWKLSRDGNIIGIYPTRSTAVKMARKLDRTVGVDVYKMTATGGWEHVSRLDGLKTQRGRA